MEKSTNPIPVIELWGQLLVPLQGETPPYETRCLWRSGDDSAALAAFLDAVRGFAPAAESAS